MPASSSDTVNPVEASLRASLGKQDSLDQQLAAKSTKVLLQKIEFTPAEKSCSFQPESIKAKYVLLNSFKTPSEAVDGNTQSKMNSANKNGETSAIAEKQPDDGIPPPKIVLFPNKVDMQWKTVRKIGAGLHNMGNTCFLNSTLQCLTYTAPLANYLMTDDHPQKCKASGFCMMCELQRHIRRCFEKPGNAIRPQTILLKLNCIAKHMHWGRQEDAHEFLRYVVDAMQKASLNGFNKLDRFSKETTVVNKVFGGFLRSQVTCLRCKEKSNTFDPLMDISLDIKNVPNIQKAFEKFVLPETLDCDNAYHCPRCKHKVSATKRFTVHRPPNVLTVQLKRFDYNKSFGGKISRHIHFSERLDIRPYMSINSGEPVMYQLYGVLVHSGGGCTSGHYFCYVKSPNQIWHCMNDSSVSQVGANRVFSSEAYLLFYSRIPPKKPHVNNMLQKAAENGPKLPNNLLNPANTKTSNGPLSSKSHDLGIPISRKPTATITSPIIGPQKPPNAPTTIPLPTKRDKVSFGIRPANSTQQSKQVECQKPRLVMHIKKNGHGYTVEKKSEKLVNGAVQKGSGLVPYGEESSDSDQENRAGAANLDIKQDDKSRPVLDKRNSEASATDKASILPNKDYRNGTEVTLCNSKSEPLLPTKKDLTKDLKANLHLESLNLNADLSKPSKNVINRTFNPLRASFSEPHLTLQTNPPKVNATTPWNVQYKDCAISPSLGSESSNTSINSTTGEWKVQGSAEKTPSVSTSDRVSTGWTVTPTRKTVENGEVPGYRPKKAEEQCKNENDKSVKSENDLNGDVEKRKLKPLILSRKDKEDEKDPLTLHIFKKNSKKENKEELDGDPSKVDAQAKVGSSIEGSDEWTIKEGENSDRKKHKKHKKHKNEHGDFKYHKLDESTDSGQRKKKKKKKKKKKHKNDDREELLSNDSIDRHERSDSHRHRVKSEADHRHYKTDNKIKSDNERRHHDKNDTDTKYTNDNDRYQDKSERHAYRSDTDRKYHDRKDPDYRHHHRSDSDLRYPEKNRDSDHKHRDRRDNGDHRHYEKSRSRFTSPEDSSSHRRKSDENSHEKNRKRSSLDDSHEIENKRQKIDGRNDWSEQGSKDRSNEREKEKARGDAPSQYWDHYVKDGYKKHHSQHDGSKSKSSWDGSRSSGVADELEKQSSSRGYGASVSSWGGGQSSLDQDVDRERKRESKRTWCDDYEEELDKGKSKKYKANTNKSDSILGNRQNIFQQLQDMRNLASEKYKFDSPPSSDRERDTFRSYKSHHSNQSRSSDHYRSSDHRRSQSHHHNNHHHHH